MKGISKATSLKDSVPLCLEHTFQEYAVVHVVLNAEDRGQR